MTVVRGNVPLKDLVHKEKDLVIQTQTVRLQDHTIFVPITAKTGQSCD